jgi:ribose-phosphate pyrophosphokinase
MVGEMTLLSGSSNRALAEGIANALGTRVASANVGRFSDGETRVEIHENVRGRDVFLIQSTSAPSNDHLMELLIMADACRRASAGRITAVIPYFGYARQDRKVQSRAPITARLVADLLEASGVDRVLTMDLHAGQIQGFFRIPVDNLHAQPLLLEEMGRALSANDAVIVSPDAGGVERARSYAAHLGATLAVIDKRRSKPNESEVMHLIGDVEGRDACIVDDMIDTAGTLAKGGAAVANHAAKRVIAAATHPVLSGPAVSRIEASVFERVLVTDTIPLGEAAAACSKIQVISVAPLFARAIRAIHQNDSIRRLFLEEGA